ncbi:hypothetical protein FHU30_005738 [Actinomadura rupiterrae]|nr:hypothetical protein [Actinomadura rupiterrae]
MAEATSKQALAPPPIPCLPTHLHTPLLAHPPRPATRTAQQPASRPRSPVTGALAAQLPIATGPPARAARLPAGQIAPPPDCPPRAVHPSTPAPTICPQQPTRLPAPHPPRPAALQQPRPATRAIRSPAPRPRCPPAGARAAGWPTATPPDYPPGAAHPPSSPELAWRGCWHLRRPPTRPAALPSSTPAPAPSAARHRPLSHLLRHCPSTRARVARLLAPRADQLPADLHRPVATAGCPAAMSCPAARLDTPAGRVVRLRHSAGRLRRSGVGPTCAASRSYSGGPPTRAVRKCRPKLSARAYTCSITLTRRGDAGTPCTARTRNTPRVRHSRRPVAPDHRTFTSTTRSWTFTTRRAADSVHAHTTCRSARTSSVLPPRATRGPDWHAPHWFRPHVPRHAQRRVPPADPTRRAAWTRCLDALLGRAAWTRCLDALLGRAAPRFFGAWFASALRCVRRHRSRDACIAESPWCSQRPRTRPARCACAFKGCRAAQGALCRSARVLKPRCPSRAVLGRSTSASSSHAGPFKVRCGVLGAYAPLGPSARRPVRVAWSVSSHCVVQEFTCCG